MADMLQPSFLEHVYTPARFFVWFHFLNITTGCVFEYNNITINIITYKTERGGFYLKSSVNLIRKEPLKSYKQNYMNT